VTRRIGWAAAMVWLGACVLASQTAAQTLAPQPARTPRKTSRSARPPLDFTGVWELDAKASQGVSRNMEGAVLSVRQNGNRIWIEPIEQKHPNLLSEEIVVDGRLYEKAVGRAEKGTLVAAWGKDKASLWLEVVVGTEQNPRAAVQRMIWRLRENGRVWTRQTRTLQPGEAKDSFLLFRKREAKH
jgi:hypothetical protein